MARVVLDLHAVERLLVRVKDLVRDLNRPPTDAEQRMVKWLEDKIADSDDSMEVIMRRVNTLRPSWGRFPFTAVEMHTLHGSLGVLREMTDADAKLIREYLEYCPKPGERFFQVRNRDKFLQAPHDTISAAEDWAKTHRRVRAKPITLNSVQSTHQDSPMGEDVKAIFSEIFKDLHNYPTKPANGRELAGEH